jgi:hypothetical protein
MKIAQPFMTGSSVHQIKSPARDGRTVLCSPPGLGKMARHESQP